MKTIVQSIAFVLATAALSILIQASITEADEFTDPGAAPSVYAVER